MRAGEVDLDALRERLVGYIDNDLKKLVIDKGGDCKPTAGFQRAVQRAAGQARSLRRAEVSGANVLLAIFPETNSPAARLLVEQGLSFQDTANFIARGIGR
jgi:ATP-dependent Clp protease ATP-binding subunit ClpA